MATSGLQPFHAQGQTAADKAATGCVLIFVASTAIWALHFNTYAALGRAWWIAAACSGPLLGFAFGALKKAFGNASVVRWMFWCSLTALLVTILATPWSM
jgi:hypothetical protein